MRLLTGAMSGGVPGTSTRLPPPPHPTPPHPTPPPTPACSYALETTDAGDSLPHPQALHPTLPRQW